MPKLPESTRRKQAIFNKGSLFYIHCAANEMRLMQVMLKNAAAVAKKSHKLPSF
jgi:hypothetical protein